MSEKQKLDIAVEIAKQTLKNASLVVDMEKVWHDFARRGSVQSRKANKILVRR